MADEFGNPRTRPASDATFFDHDRHAEALVLLTSAHLTRESPSSAFPFADRRCRILKPAARDLLLRAEASRMAGFVEHARADLVASLEIDPNDSLNNIGALSWGGPDLRLAAARRLVDDENASMEILALAVEALLADGVRAVPRLSWSGRFLIGWIAWNGGRPIEIQTVGPNHAARFVLDRDSAHHLSGHDASAASFAILDDDGRLRGLELFIDGEIVASVSAPPRTRVATPTRTRRDNGTSGATSRLDVIVPVYEDFEATRACLASLLAQPVAEGRRIIAVDDASPNAELREYLDQASERGDLELIRNPVNLGFAEAVNAALSLSDAGDVLIVNADAWLPPGAIDRLAAVARSAPDIGTVTPFSNNGEFTSYPAPNVANSMPSHQRICELDALARRANGDAVVDLPNGIGFCLYVTRACLDAAGPLSRIYLRGYYEDVEFCLKARERGFRNVCATGVFVGHAGSLSFRDAKRALVVRNLGVLELRFPGYRLQSAAFLAADPLRRARAEIDELAPPEGGLVMLASVAGKSSRLAQMRAEAIVAANPVETVLHCVVELIGGRIEIRRQGDGAPRSLRFRAEDSDALAGFRAYLDRLTIRRLEIFDAPAIPEEISGPLIAACDRVELICGDLEWFGRLAAPHLGACEGRDGPGVCEACGGGFAAKENDPEQGPRSRDRLNFALSRVTAVRPLDRVGEAFARRVFKTKALALGDEANRATAAGPGADSGNAVLGVLAPAPSAAADRLLTRLGRLLARAPIPTKIVVIGGCVDDLALMAVGDVFVTGPAEPREYERLAAQYGVGPLFLPDRTAFFGLLDAVALARGAPKAYFDWSFGAMATRPGDLSIDPRICDEKACETIAFWLGSIYRNGAA